MIVTTRDDERMDRATRPLFFVFVSDQPLASRALNNNATHGEYGGILVGAASGIFLYESTSTTGM